MIGNTLTTENLLDILKAMQKIKPIDQSQYYTQYMNEIIERLKENEILSKLSNQGTREPIENKV